MSKGRPRDGALEAKWRRILALQSSSGLSVREFCRRHGLQAASLHFWRRTLRVRDQAASLAPRFVELSPALEVMESPIELLVGGRRVLLRTGCDLPLLGQVIQVLEATPC